MPKNDFGQFTYVAADGKRKLKRYVIAWIALVVVMVVLIVFGVNQRGQERYALAASRAVTVEPSQTPTQKPSPTPESCPSDPAKWNMIDAVPGSNYKRIEPLCVYDGLGRTVAWVLAIRMGYSRQQATDLLGFDSAPAQPRASLSVLTSTDGPVQVNLTYAIMDDTFTEWSITENESLAMTYTLQGCFRTATVVGSQRHYWGDGYSVICVLAQDTTARYHISKYGDSLYTGVLSDAVRATAYLGYDANRNWVWIGNQKNSFLYLYSIDGLEENQSAMAGMYNTPVWNSRWMEAVYGISPVALPFGWQSATDEKARDDFLRILTGK